MTKSSKFQMLREDSNMPIATLSMYPNMLANKRKGLLLMARLYKMFNMGNLNGDLNLLGPAIVKHLFGLSVRRKRVTNCLFSVSYVYATA